MTSVNPILAQVIRNDFVESVHRGRLVIVSPSGEVVEEYGDIRSTIFPRSANKPLQAVGMLRVGAPLHDAELAITAGSHRGEPVHTALVAKMLANAGLDTSALQCPADLPKDSSEHAKWIKSGRSPERIAMMCSGKHAGMLATCAANNWDPNNYCDPSHPLQQALANTVSELAGEKIGPIGIDGCGGPIFSVSLLGLARGYARLVTAPDGSAERKVVDAMRSYPHLVEGSAGKDTAFMTAIPGLLCKQGAEMVLAAAIPNVGALALKIDDGAMHVGHVLLAAALRRMNVAASELAAFREISVFGGGRPVGTISATI